MLGTVTEADWDLFDETRRLYVRNPDGYGYRHPQAGWWDVTGRAHCLNCPPADGLGIDEIDGANSAPRLCERRVETKATSNMQPPRKSCSILI